MLDTPVDQFSDITSAIQQAVMAVTVQVCKGASWSFRHDLVHRRSFLIKKCGRIAKRLRRVAFFKGWKAESAAARRSSNVEAAASFHRV
ncbi:MAG: hypothetical protein L7W43_18260 [Rubripirellula sp.]|nr:hypothetical protein [Rubripirellula sp.]